MRLGAVATLAFVRVVLLATTVTEAFLPVAPVTTLITPHYFHHDDVCSTPSVPRWSRCWALASSTVGDTEGGDASDLVAKPPLKVIDPLAFGCAHGT